MLSMMSSSKMYSPRHMNNVDDWLGITDVIEAPTLTENARFCAGHCGLPSYRSKGIMMRIGN